MFPIPEDVAYYRKCADEYLYTLAPAFGQLRTIVEPQGCYRIHGRNIYSSRSFFDRVKLEQEGYDDHCRAVSAALLRNGMSVDINNVEKAFMVSSTRPRCFENSPNSSGECELGAG